MEVALDTREFRPAAVGTWERNDGGAMTEGAADESILADVDGAERSKELRALTVGQWLDRIDARGWTDAKAWCETRDCACAAVGAVRRFVRSACDADDLVSDLLILARTKIDSWRRPQLRDLPLVRWFAGVAKKLLLARRRRVHILLGDSEDSIPARSAEDDTSGMLARRRDELRRLATKVLTSKQRAAIELLLGGNPVRRAARALGTTRDAYRDLVRRARRKLRDAAPSPD